MTTKLDSQTVEDALRSAGLTWLLDYWGADKAKNLLETTQAISDFVAYYASRFGQPPDPIRLLQENPIKGRAFFQFDTLIASSEMKAMVWRILEGCEVARIDLHYDREGTLSLDVRLRTPYGEGEDYTSNYWADFRVLRHFGTAKSGDRLCIDGYYASK